VTKTIKLQKHQKNYEKALHQLLLAQIDLMESFPVGTVVSWFVSRGCKYYQQEGVVIGYAKLKNRLANISQGRPLISPPCSHLIRVKNTKTGTEKWLSYFDLLPFLGVISDYWKVDTECKAEAESES
jgi:hypothetical protein